MRSNFGKKSTKMGKKLVEVRHTMRAGTHHMLRHSHVAALRQVGGPHQATTVVARQVNERSNVIRSQESCFNIMNSHQESNTNFKVLSGAIACDDSRALSLTPTLTAISEATEGDSSVEAHMEPNSLTIDEADINHEGEKADINHEGEKEYAKDLLTHYRKAEVQFLVPPTYIYCYSEIDEAMRGEVVDWLIALQCAGRDDDTKAIKSPSFMPETLFLAINLLDRYLAAQVDDARPTLWLVGITALFIAAKYEEVVPLFLNQILSYSQGLCTRSDILGTEKCMLKALQFRLSVPTPYVFIMQYLKLSSRGNLDLEHLVCFLAELCLAEYAMLRYIPSHLAAAAVYTARCAMKISPCWPDVLQRKSGYAEKQLAECAKRMVELHRMAAAGPFEALVTIYLKYSTTEYNKVATIMAATIPTRS